MALYVQIVGGIDRRWVLRNCNLKNQIQADATNIHVLQVLGNLIDVLIESIIVIALLQ